MANNASQFTAQRPQAYYPPVQQVNKSANVGILGGLMQTGGGILDMWKAVQQLTGQDPQSKYYAAQEQNWQNARLGEATKELSGLSPGQREARRQAMIAADPTLEAALNKLDLNNMTMNDPSMKGMYEEQQRIYDIMSGRAQPNEGGQQPQGLGADVGNQLGAAHHSHNPQEYEKANLGQWSQTMGPVEPTPVDVSQTGFVGPEAPEAPSQGQYEVVDAPEPTAVQLPDIEMSPEEQAINEVAKNGMFQADDLWYSKNTGEVKVKPEARSRHPWLPPAAFMDVPAAGPEDPIIREVNQQNVAPVFDATEELLRSGAAFRVYRAMNAGVDPSNSDLLAVRLHETAMKKYKAELMASQIGILDPDLIKESTIFGVSNFLNAALPDEIRNHPKTIGAYREFLTLPPTYQKVVMDAASKSALNSMDYAQFLAKQAQFDQKLALDTRKQTFVESQGAIEAAQKDRELGIKDKDADANVTRAQADALNAGVGILTPQEKRRELLSKIEHTEALAKAANTNASLAEFKLAAKKSGKDPEMVKELLGYLGDQAGRRSVVVKDYRDSINQVSRSLENSRKELNDFVAKYDGDPSQTMIREMAMNAPLPTDPAKRKALIDFRASESGAKILGRINEIRANIEESEQQLNGYWLDPKDHSKGTDPKRPGLISQGAAQREQLDKELGATASDQIKNLMRTRMVVDPDMAKTVWYSHASGAMPNSKSVHHIMDALDYAFPNGDPHLDENTPAKTPEQVRDLLMSIAATGGANPNSDEFKRYKSIRVFLKQGGVDWNATDVRNAAQKWLEWMDMKNEIMSGKAK